MRWYEELGLFGGWLDREGGVPTNGIGTLIKQARMSPRFRP